MTDILGVLDAAIEEFGRNRQRASGTSREQNGTGTATGTPNPLKMNRVPALPVVPVANEDVSTEDLIENREKPAVNRGERAPEIYPLQNTGSTGSTGTHQAFCGFPSSRALLANGNYGKSVDDADLRQDQLSRLLNHGLFIDFETRSCLNLREVGSSVYAEHSSTEVWVACYAIGNGPVQAWYPGAPCTRRSGRARQRRTAADSAQRDLRADDLGEDHGTPAWLAGT
jgi:hypothetical protein